MSAAPPDRQRIDKWLWHARVARTRSAAAALVGGGHVRLNGARTEATSQPVRLGDVITVGLDRSVRVLKVKGFADRRGASVAARTLYDDLSPALPAKPVREVAGVRAPGAVRPIKRERRAIDRVLHNENAGPDDES